MAIIHETSRAIDRLDLSRAFWEYQSSGESDFIATDVLPIYNSNKRGAKFSKITKESILQVVESKRAPKGNYGRVDYNTSDDSFSCEEYGLEGVVDDVERALYASDFDAEYATAKIVSEAVLRNQEIRAAAAVFDPTIWSGADLFKDHSANDWADITTDIIGQIIDGKQVVKQNSGIMPDTLIVSSKNLSYMLKNTGIRSQFPGERSITLEQILSSLLPIFGLTKLRVGGAAKNTADEGQDASVATVWGDKYVMIAKTCNENDPLDTPCIGRTPLWTEDSPENIVIEQYREEGARGDIIRVRQHTDEKILEPAFGYLMDIEA